jgi:uncharacterized FlaG/YvyC family protein
MAEIVHLSGNSIPMPKREARPAAVQHAVPKVESNVKNTEPTELAIPKPKMPEPDHMINMSDADFSKLLNKMNIYLDQFQIQARYTVSSSTGHTRVEIFNRSTGEVIRTIPPFEAAELVKDIGVNAGQLLDQKV